MAGNYLGSAEAASGGGKPQNKYVDVREGEIVKGDQLHRKTRATGCGACMTDAVVVPVA